MHILPQGDTMRVIYAYDKDTPDPTSLAMPYHDYRGIKPLYLMEPRTAAKIPEPGELYWDVRAPNVSVWRVGEGGGEGLDEVLWRHRSGRGIRGTR